MSGNKNNLLYYKKKLLSYIHRSKSKGHYLGNSDKYSKTTQDYFDSFRQ